MNQRDEGSIAVIAAVAFLPLCLMLAIVVDSGRVWVGRTRLQNSVEAAAIAAAQNWMTKGQACSATALAVVSSDGSAPTAVQCSVTGSKTSGVTRVTATESIGLTFAGLVGRSSSVVSASTGVRIGAVGSAVGVWPFGLCSQVKAVSDWIASGMTTATSTAIRFEDQNQKCGGSVSGNWGVLDFNGGSSSNAETKDWVDNGYLGVVKVGDWIIGSPGAPSSSLDIQSIVGKSVIMPMFSSPRLSGSNVEYRVVGFAKARVDAVQFTGGASSRSIRITLQAGTITGSSASLGGTNFGLVGVGVCSLDSTGSCT
jgi:Putative Flp pilus-assembly TadE/G-like